MEEKVFNLLKVSYDRLRNDKYRQCLHYCAMFREDFLINRDNLIEYWISGGLIDELDTRQEEFDLGNTIIDELVDASLLENFSLLRNDKLVKMHDVVRDTVLSITRGKLMVKACLLLLDFPKFTHWSADLEGISIMGNRYLRGCSFNSAPHCNKLGILLMQNNVKLLELPSWFFVHMQNLTILDMSNLYSLKLLPDSISKLKALRMLNLDVCPSQEYIPSLAALKDLRHLNLSLTKLRNLPEGMEKLVNLKLLYIKHANALCGVITSEVLKELSLLQSLNLEGSDVEVEPEGLSSLQKLETLGGVDFRSFNALNSYLEWRHWKSLGRYTISSKQHEFNHGFYDEEDNYDRVLLWCKDKDWDSTSKNGTSTDFVIPLNVELLRLMNWDGPMDGALINGGFAHLKRLTLKKCKLKYLISVVSAQQLLQNLNYLEVGDCADIEEIIGTEESLNQSNLKKYSTIELPKLSRLRLGNLPRLRSIYRGNLELPYLFQLEIDECEKLERLPFHELPVEFHGSNCFSKLWWVHSSGTINITSMFFRNSFMNPKTMISPVQNQKRKQGVWI